MIFELDDRFVKECPPATLSDISCSAAANGHFFITSKESRRIIRDAVARHGSTNEKIKFRAHGDMFSPARDYTSFLRKVSVTDTASPHTVLFLVNAPALVILENAFNEWIVYKYIIDAYSTHPQLKDAVGMLRKAKDAGRIQFIHAGGWSTELAALDYMPYHDADGRNLKLVKSMVVFDRDTKDETSFDGTKNSLFRRLAGKKHTEMTDTDVYNLDVREPMWHMWYKRAIENYFPDEAYRNVGCDTSAVVGMEACDRDYLKIPNKDGGSITGYDKSMLPMLIHGMTRKKFEDNLKKFDVKGVKYSEFEIFLLKMARII